MGAWIETSRTHQTKQKRFVAPYVGAWIETHRHMFTAKVGECRTLRGCVD